MEVKGIITPGKFALKSAQPLDARSVVDSFSDLTELVTKGYAYKGMTVYVNSNDGNGGLYICESIESGGIWERVGSGSGSGSDLPLEAGTGSSSVQQVADGVAAGINFVGANPRAEALDSTLSSTQPYGAIGNFSVALGGKSSAQGKRSLAEGTTTVAKGGYSHAEGNNSVSWGPNSHAEGRQTTAYGYNTHAEGLDTVAQGHHSHAEGQQTTALGDNSHAEGYQTVAGTGNEQGHSAHAEGIGTKATHNGTHAEGVASKAGRSYYDTPVINEYNSFNSENLTFICSEVFPSDLFTEGDICYIITADNILQVNWKGTVSYIGNPRIGVTFESVDHANQAKDFLINSGYTCRLRIFTDQLDIDVNDLGSAAHAEGNSTIAAGPFSHAEGNGTKALGSASHTEGTFNITYAAHGHAEGLGTVAIGNASHAEGDGTKALGSASHVEGTFNITHAAHGHAEGLRTVAVGNASHAEGDGGEAELSNAIKEIIDAGDPAQIASTWNSNKNFSAAVGFGTHVEGISTMASGAGAHAEGMQTGAWANYSHAGGLGTKATAEAQTVIGKYNKEEANAKFIVGNGTSNADRSNAFAVYDTHTKVGAVNNDKPCLRNIMVGYDLPATVETCSNINPVAIGERLPGYYDRYAYYYSDTVVVESDGALSNNDPINTQASYYILEHIPSMVSTISIKSPANLNNATICIYDRAATVDSGYQAIIPQSNLNNFVYKYSIYHWVFTIPENIAENLTISISQNYSNLGSLKISYSTIDSKDGDIYLMVEE